jgi:type IV secretion system protein VirD4
MKGIRLCYSQKSGKIIRYKGPGHLILTAPTRSGKATDVLIPALLEFEGSVICIDPKGELAAVTGRRRKKFGRVMCLNPFGILRKELARLDQVKYNPMAGIDPSSPTRSVDCDKLADAIVWNEGDNRDSHWIEGSKELCSGVADALITHGRPEERNLAVLRDVIGGDVIGFCRAIIEKSTDRFIRQKLMRFALKGAEESREILDVIATLKVQTRFSSNPIISESLSASNFAFKDLTRKATTVYLILPLSHLDVCGKWFRLIVGSALSEILRNGANRVQTLLMLDEFVQLGALKAIQNAMGMAAGFGVQLWPVLQDLNQLKGLYRDSWETFLSNTGARMFFRPNDQFTSEYLSEICGDSEVVSYQKNYGYDMRVDEPSVSITAGQSSRRLMLPHEVRDLGSDEALLFTDGVNGPILGHRKPYWKMREFSGKYRPNPYYRSGGLGGFIKRLFGGD